MNDQLSVQIDRLQGHPRAGAQLHADVTITDTRGMGAPQTYVVEAQAGRVGVPQTGPLPAVVSLHDKSGAAINSVEVAAGKKAHARLDVALDASLKPGDKLTVSVHAFTPDPDVEFATASRAIVIKA